LNFFSLFCRKSISIYLTLIPKFFTTGFNSLHLMAVAETIINQRTSRHFKNIHIKKVLPHEKNNVSRIRKKTFYLKCIVWLLDVSKLIKNKIIITMFDNYIKKGYPHRICRFDPKSLYQIENLPEKSIFSTLKAPTCKFAGLT
jgi:bifunctional pyridoxal-dependent enzyme with beta-cystathionase and maltose regulon repressor activities